MSPGPNTWVIATTGRPSRKRHRIRPDRYSICGMLGPATPTIPATSDAPACSLCDTRPIDLAAQLSNYTVSVRGCWIWGGYMDPNGYGRVHVRQERRIEWVHRVSYEHHVGPIPHRHEIDHTCQITACLNPGHLEAVTKVEHAARTFRRLGGDNRQAMSAQMRRAGLTYQEIADALHLAGRSGAASAVKAAVRKGLVAADQVPPVRYLTDEEREDIRGLYLFGVPQTTIGRFYEIDGSQVSRICNGMRSGHTAGRAAA